MAHLNTSALLPGFDAPWEIGPAVVVEDGVVDCGVDVFGVDEEAVDVEDAGANWGEGGDRVG